MPKRSPQLTFEGFIRPKDSFGGSLLKNSHAKCKRPLESKLPIHLVLRANKGGMRLPKTFKRVNETMFRVARKHGVKIFEFANVGNHLHLLVKIPHVRRWAAFIRELSGRIAQVARGIVGTQKKETAGFWKQRPFTRIVRGWNRAFRTMKDYVELNRLEAEGFISRRETKTLSDLRAILGIWGELPPL